MDARAADRDDLREPEQSQQIARRRFIILSLVLFVLMSVQQWGGHWLGDFWEHSAVVRELALHPLRPMHPQLPLDAPHAFFTPYHLAVALVARLAGLGPVSVLAIAGTFNLLLLLVGIYRFGVDVLRDRATAPILLVLMLFLWGFPPFIFSGFISGGLLGLVLPYPSTFVTALMLLGIALEARWVRQAESSQASCVAVTVALVLLHALAILTHPITAVTFILASIAFAIDAARQRQAAKCILLLCAAPAGVALATMWPYYPLWQLLTTQSAVYNESNRTVYPGVLLLAMLGPVLIGVGAMITRWRRNHTDPLALTALALIVLYFFGGVTGRWTIGRVLAGLAILLQAAVAGWLVTEAPAAGRALRRAVYGIVFVFCIPWAMLTLAVVGFSLKPRIEMAVPQYNDQYAFIETAIHEGDVVLADLEAGWVIPTFGAKVVAAQHPLAFVPDHEGRQADVVRFFKQGTSIDERRQLLARYDVKFLLIRAGRSTAADDEAQMRSLGKVVREVDGLILVRIEPDMTQ